MTVQDIIYNVNIVEYISQFVDLKSENKEYISLCPFHEERTPSFSITPETQLYYCFGCHSGGSVLDFIRKYNNCSFQEALEILKKYANINEKFIDNRLNATKVIKQYRPKKNTGEKVYHQIFDKNIMQKYDDNLDKIQVWLNDGISKEILNKYQVKYDIVSNRLVYPIRDLLGNIIAIKGRTLDINYKDKLIDGKKIRKYTYYNHIGDLDIIFGYSEHINFYKLKKEIILFEGEKSIMLSDTYGINNTGALLTSSLNLFQLKILIKLGIRTIFALDKEIDILEDKNIIKLSKYVPVEYIRDNNNLIELKMSPIDKGKEIFLQLYNERRRLN